MAILYREEECSFKRILLPNPQDIEVVVGSVRFAGFAKLVVVVGCYLPPTYAPSYASAALDYVRYVVTHVKRTYNSPYVIVSGDFNQWKLEDALADFVDLEEAPVGATRRAIYSPNWSRSMPIFWQSP